MEVSRRVRARWARSQLHTFRLASDRVFWTLRPLKVELKELVSLSDG